MKIMLSTDDLQQHFSEKFLAEYFAKFPERRSISLGTLAQRCGVPTALDLFLDMRGSTNESYFLVRNSIERIWGSARDPLIREGIDLFYSERPHSRSQSAIEEGLRGKWASYLGAESPGWVNSYVSKEVGKGNGNPQLRKHIDVEALGAHIVQQYMNGGYTSYRTLNACLWAAPNRDAENAAQLLDFLTNISS